MTARQPPDGKGKAGNMKLYIDFTRTVSYEVEATEADILAALAAQDISYQDGETLDDLLQRVEGTLPGELAFASLATDADDVDTSETWSLTDWEDDE